MSARRVVAAIALLAGLVVLTAATYRRREFQRWLDEETASPDRYVDAHVRLHVVVKDPFGKETNPAKLPKLRTHELGGWIDTQWTPPRLMPECEYGEGQDWYCSEEQEQLIFHSDDAPVGKLALGGMGAGKTSAGVIWTYLRWLESIDERVRLWDEAVKATEEDPKAPTPTLKQIEGGITAPTASRVKVVVDEITAKFSPSWFRYSSTDGLFTMCDGTLIRCIGTYRQSASQGSRIQGFNWAFWMGDELQDQLNEYINIHARLRSKADGRAKRLGTATEKDSPEWRTFKTTLVESGDWITHSMLGPRSPFIAQAHWDSMERSLTKRDYRRLVLAEDLPSESRLYLEWNRKRNLRPLPLVGARKITSIVLSRKTGDKRDAIGIGHDPGTAKAGSVWLDAYELSDRKGDVLWWVRGELFTLHRSAEQHAVEAMKITRDRFGCNVRPDSDRAHVRCQPMGQAEDKPDLDVFATWQRIGFSIKAAQYSKQGQGVGSIKKDSRIGVVNTLFEKERLFIECDDRGAPVAPLLVEALETMERDYLGRAEREEKVVKHDKSDLPAALGYFLWPFEKELAVALRADIQRGLTV